MIYIYIYTLHGIAASTDSCKSSSQELSASFITCIPGLIHTTPTLRSRKYYIHISSVVPPLPPPFHTSTPASTLYPQRPLLPHGVRVPKCIAQDEILLCESSEVLQPIFRESAVCIYIYTYIYPNLLVSIDTLAVSRFLSICGLVVGWLENLIQGRREILSESSLCMYVRESGFTLINACF